MEFSLSKKRQIGEGVTLGLVISIKLTYGW